MGSPGRRSLPPTLSLILFRDEVDRAQVLTIAFEHPSHRQNPFSSGIIEYYILCQSQSAENPLILDETQGPEKVHWRISDANDTETSTFQQRLPCGSGKRASADMNNRREGAIDFALLLGRHVAGNDGKLVNAIASARTEQPECLRGDQALLLGSLHAQHGLADDYGCGRCRQVC